MDDEEDDIHTNNSVSKAFKYIPRIIVFRKRNADKPHMKDIFYVRGILRNRISYCNERRALSSLVKAYEEENADIYDLKMIALNVRNWTGFVSEMFDKYGVDV